MARAVSVFFAALIALQVCVWVPVALADVDHSAHTTTETPTAADAGTDHSTHTATATEDDDTAAVDHSEHDHSAMSSEAPSTAESQSGAMPMCAEAPNLASCATYNYPDARSELDIETNCEAMPFMVGCSVWQACKDGDMSGDICMPFNVLASTCQDQDMKNMPGCAVYTPMCLDATDSVVDQCVGAGISRLVSTMPTQSAILENCGTHNMPGCEDCTSEASGCPDTLATLQRVCNAHAMEMCSEYNSMCAVNGAAMEFFCSNREGEFDPPMRMYFHNGIRDILLFRNFVPENNGEYAGAIILFIVVGIVASALRVWRSVMEAAERIERNKVVRANTGVVAEQNVLTVPSQEVLPRVQHGILSFVILTLDYALMLVAMSFNVGIFFAVVTGLALGMFMFRHIGSRAMERMQARSLLESPACGCKPTAVGYESIAMGTCCDISKHARANSEGKDGSGNISAEKACCAVEGAAGAKEAALSGEESRKLRVAGKCASRQSVGDPDLLANDGTDPACCGP